MFNKKEIKLDQVEKLINLIDELNKSYIRNIEVVKEFNDSYIRTLERIKELEENQSKIKTTLKFTTACLVQSYADRNLINEDGELILPYNDKDYILVADYRTTSLINKDIAVKVLEINADGIKSKKYTSLNSLTEEEKKEYKQYGFIVIRNKE